MTTRGTPPPTPGGTYSMVEAGQHVQRLLDEEGERLGLLSARERGEMEGVLQTSIAGWLEKNPQRLEADAPSPGPAGYDGATAARRMERLALGGRGDVGRNLMEEVTRQASEFRQDQAERGDLYQRAVALGGPAASPSMDAAAITSAEWADAKGFGIEMTSDGLQAQTKSMYAEMMRDRRERHEIVSSVTKYRAYQAKVQHRTKESEEQSRTLRFDLSEKAKDLEHKLRVEARQREHMVEKVERLGETMSLSNRDIVRENQTRVLSPDATDFVSQSIQKLAGQSRSRHSQVEGAIGEGQSPVPRGRFEFLNADEELRKIREASKSEVKRQLRDQILRALVEESRQEAAEAEESRREPAEADGGSAERPDGHASAPLDRSPPFGGFRTSPLQASPVELKAAASVLRGAGARIQQAGDARPADGPTSPTIASFLSSPLHERHAPQGTGVTPENFYSFARRMTGGEPVAPAPPGGREFDVGEVTGRAPAGGKPKLLSPFKIRETPSASNVLAANFTPSATAGLKRFIIGSKDTFDRYQDLNRELSRMKTELDRKYVRYQTELLEEKGRDAFLDTAGGGRGGGSLRRPGSPTASSIYAETVERLDRLQGRLDSVKVQSDAQKLKDLAVGSPGLGFDRRSPDSIATAGLLVGTPRK